ncbi:restriction endonuclease subunit S [Streptomyces sp. NPDC056056]|uniref:restriction endonuclease subunit S n=1 Tax=Streptomyces sp. NPDC056056 TaxID=3345698 RepID=UPI0035DA1E2A
MNVLPNGWVTARLGEVVVDGKLTNGLSPSTGGTVEHRVLTLSAVTSGEYRAAESKTAHFAKMPAPEQLVREGCFLLSRGNGNPDLVGVGVVAAVGDEPIIYPDTVIGGIVDRSKVVPSYLAAIWKSREVRQQIRKAARTTNGTFKVNQKSLGAVTFPLPPLDEQQRIARILDRIDTLRAKRRSSITLLDELVRATFRNDFLAKDIERVPFGSVVADRRLGIVRSAKEQDPSHAYPYVKMDAITREGRLNLHNLARVAATAVEAEANSVSKGDLLFNTRNSREWVGKSAIYPGGDEVRLINNNIMRIRTDPAKAVPEFIHAYLWSREGRSALQSRQSGTTSVIAIYWKSLATIPVPLPPLAVQQEFAAKVRHVEIVRQRYLEHLAQLDALFATLQSRAFCGEL